MERAAGTTEEETVTKGDKPAATTRAARERSAVDPAGAPQGTYGSCDAHRRSENPLQIEPPTGTFGARRGASRPRRPRLSRTRELCVTAAVVVLPFHLTCMLCPRVLPSTTSPGSVAPGYCVQNMSPTMGATTCCPSPPVIGCGWRATTCTGGRGWPVAAGICPSLRRRSSPSWTPR